MPELKTSLFYKLHFHADEVQDPEAMQAPAAIRGAVRFAAKTPPAANVADTMKNWNDETAARYYMNSLLENSGHESLFSLTAPDRPEVTPDLHLEGTLDSPLTDTRVVKFSQNSESIPIFGAEAFVEIDGNDRRLVSFDAQLATAPDVPSVASLSPKQAISAIAEYAHVDPVALDDVKAPDLQYFQSEDSGKWHLVYYFRDVPAIPPGELDELHAGHGQGIASSPRRTHATFEYLVDAHNGEIVFFFSSHPMIDIPTPCIGDDVTGITRDFFGVNIGTQFEMRDPLRNIETYDFNFGDIDSASAPANPIGNTTANFGSASPAGVSAHYFATLVFDFYNDVLKRNGVDDKGMKLQSLVQVTYPAEEAPPEWHNAVWWNSRMWYGQALNGNGDLESYARFFDVIAHELTHGVTETTSNLVYKNQSGALNESFSDIFGIMIKNWYPNKPNPVSAWDWELGSGLGPGGLPLRDMRDPTRTGDPDHMNDYLFTSGDNGGVHTNSNIHNKAAYNLITLKDNAGNPVFQPQEAAILYYLTLARLTRLADFSDCLRTLLSVASTYYSGNSQVQQEKRAAITRAYQDVGIT